MIKVKERKRKPNKRINGMSCLEGEKRRGKAKVNTK